MRCERVRTRCSSFPRAIAYGSFYRGFLCESKCDTSSNGLNSHSVSGGYASIIEVADGVKEGQCEIGRKPLFSIRVGPDPLLPSTEARRTRAPRPPRRLFPRVTREKYNRLPTDGH